MTLPNTNFPSKPHEFLNVSLEKITMNRAERSISGFPENKGSQCLSDSKKHHGYSLQGDAPVSSL